MMTEEEATTKWCPFANVANRAGNAAVGNRLNDGVGAPVGTECIGSVCMAWRTANKKLGHSLSYHLETKSRAEAERDFAHFHRAEPLVGYCGLAGKP